MGKGMQQDVSNTLNVNENKLLNCFWDSDILSSQNGVCSFLQFVLGRDSCYHFSRRRLPMVIVMELRPNLKKSYLQIKTSTYQLLQREVFLSDLFS